MCETLGPSPARQKKKRKPEWRTYIYRPRRSERLFLPILRMVAEDGRNYCHLANGTGGDLQGTVQLRFGELGGDPRSLKEPSTPPAQGLDGWNVDRPPHQPPSAGTSLKRPASKNTGQAESHATQPYSQWQPQWARVACRNQKALLCRCIGWSCEVPSGTPCP